MVNVDLSSFYENPCLSCIYSKNCLQPCEMTTDSIVPTNYMTDDEYKEKYLRLLDEYVKLVKHLGFNPVFDKR